MTPIHALLRASLPSRAWILVAFLVLCALMRGLVADSDWIGSERQSIAIIVIQLGVLPVFAAMFGGALISGEHAPWAWGLARPITRARWAAVIVATDLVTLAVATGLCLAILGSPPDLLGSTLLGDVSLVGSWPRATVGPALALLTYLGAALGATRGHSTLRALPVALGYVAPAVLLTSVLLWADRGIAGLFVIDAWPTPPGSGLVELADEFDEFVLAALVSLAAVPIATTGALVHLLLRGMHRVPARMTSREIFSVFALWSVAYALVATSLHSRTATIDEAPTLARRGGANVTVVAPRTLHGARLNRVILAEPGCDRCLARAALKWDSGFARFDDVLPGPYDVCLVLFDGRALLERCVGIELRDGDAEIAPDFASAVAGPDIDRPSVWEHHRGLRRSWVLDDLADMLRRALG